ncbi:MAG TPA: SAM-dependent methyltransferase [Actinoallomurus sp.]
MTDDSPIPAGQDPLPEIDSTVPHSARIWNYWLGGKDNYAVDRQAGEEFCEIFPGMVDVARAVRYFLGRAVRYLAGEAGIRQFLDIGTGLPTVDNTHEIAQRIAPESRIVYVDNDPLVLAHARALLTSTPPGATDYIDADLRDPDTILDAAARTLDFSQPIGLMLLGVMAHIRDDEARPILDRLLDALPSGSHLVLSDGTNTDKAREEAHRRYNSGGAVPYLLRSPEQIAGFFDGLELLEPGVVSVSQWRPDPSPFGPPAKVSTFGGVARRA